MNLNRYVFFETQPSRLSDGCAKREFFIRKLAAVGTSAVRPYSFATPAFAGCAICVGRIALIYSYQGTTSIFLGSVRLFRSLLSRLAAIARKQDEGLLMIRSMAIGSRWNCFLLNITIAMILAWYWAPSAENRLEKSWFSVVFDDVYHR